MKTLLAAVVVLNFSATLGFAHSGHQGKITDLKTASPSHQVKEVAYCGGVYNLKFNDGSEFSYPEFNLRFKTDSSPNGPKTGTPVQIPAGMRGDRAYIVFSHPQEISGFIKRTC